ncbi:leucyl aminopeptidase [Buchnera aphidicola (Neophyllaphis podocarpi)]|uniref:leucyl aminopeptidase n=1 Tax=Buchnera aphidicola TaxID=9 RepID=UPI0031B815B7
MKYDVCKIKIKNLNNKFFVLGVFDCFNKSNIITYSNIYINKYLRYLIKNSKLNTRFGKYTLINSLNNSHNNQFLIMGCGTQKKFDLIKYKKLIYRSISILNDMNVQEVIFLFLDLNIKNLDIYWKTRFLIESIEHKIYNFSFFKKSNDSILLNNIILNVNNSEDINIVKNALKISLSISIGLNKAKDIGNMPPNVCNPLYLSEISLDLLNKYNNFIKVKIIDENKMTELGMSAYLAVGGGSHNKSYMSLIEFKNTIVDNLYDKKIVLVGKGLTFDSGGISLKPSFNMDEMKYDMCGAAVVYGIMVFLAELKLPLHVIGVLAGCENMPGNNSFRPGDIIKTMSGKTVEVLDTDAEGRLVLCDVLTYINRFDPYIVIDIATLTGACVVALGKDIHGLFSNDDSLSSDLLHASNQTGDIAWNLPLFKKYSEQLKSNFADISNIGNKSAGAITAACFLSHFIGNYKWAHFDIAGTAYNSGVNKGSTGRPLFLIAQFLLNLSKIVKN